ncbi:MAG: translation initiation factor IF-2 subunit beta [Candidatus Woesearchaeota archaeon]
MTPTYEELLDKGKKELPEQKDSGERFEIPKVRGQIEGNKTLITNFEQITQTLNRPAQHFMKFILKELATKGEMRKQAAIFNAKIPASKINEKIQKYADLYVFCKECGKPDSKLLKEQGFLFVRCQACGAKYSVRG